jgi:hypothetical protein
LQRFFSWVAEEKPVECVAITLMSLGFGAGSVGEWIILLRAYRCSLPCFLACLCLPFGTWLFAVFDMPRPAVPLTLTVGGAVLWIAGGCLLGADAWSL